MQLRLDVYNPGTTLSIVLQGQTENEKYYITALLLRVGLHFFIETNQLKGFETDLDLRSGILLLSAPGNAVVLQAGLEFPFSYRFVLSIYSRSSWPYENLRISGRRACRILTQ